MGLRGHEGGAAHFAGEERGMVLECAAGTSRGFWRGCIVGGCLACAVLLRRSCVDAVVRPVGYTGYCRFYNMYIGRFDATCQTWRYRRVFVRG